MSWRRITGEQRIPRACFVGGYDETGCWRETAAYRRSSGEWGLLSDIYSDVSHTTGYFAPFEAPEPPPKPMSLKETAQEAGAFLSIIRKLLPRDYHERAQEIILGLLDAIACEETDAER